MADRPPTQQHARSQTNIEKRMSKQAVTATATATATSTTAKGAVTMLPQAPKKQWFVTTAPATFDSVSLVSTALGAVIGVGAVLAVSGQFELGVYIGAMGLFHVLEFWVTARYNQGKLGMNSYLLTNGVGYVVAQLAGVAEIGLRLRLCEGRARTLSAARVAVTAAALTCIIGGQIVRTAAMVQAAESFNHFVQTEKRPEHRLVTSGMYRLVRHPSYFGYYVWAVGTQLLVRNWVCAVFFAITLNVYFRQRLGPEEHALVRFFGSDYRAYRREVWSGIFFF